MKKLILIALLISLFSFNSYSQHHAIKLSFTAIDNISYVVHDSVKIINQSQGADTVLCYPDTVLVLDYQAQITEKNYEREHLQIFQNFPNPVTDQTIIKLYIPEKGKIKIIVTDIIGHETISKEQVIEKGVHSFRFSPGKGNFFFFTVYCTKERQSIKIVSSATNHRKASTLDYIGYKANEITFKKTQSTKSFDYNIGDTLLCIAYQNGLESAMIDAPVENKLFSFQFAFNIPCPGIPTIIYDGQIYNTVQIFSQCWLKENLNAGTMVEAYQEMLNNGIIEKYCYENELDSCDKYGGLYQWNEMMQYATLPGAQGICPDGWHIPTNEEWKILEGTVDSQYGVGNPVWDMYDLRGFDVGKNLKSTFGWYENGNGTDLFGFTALPAGSNAFSGVGEVACIWSSSMTNLQWVPTISWERILYYPDDGMYFNYWHVHHSRSVRCLKGNGSNIQADFSAINSNGIKPLTVNFTDYTSNLPFKWHWDFGDGGTSEEQNPSHVYTDEGIYTVTLTATNLSGSDFKMKRDYICVINNDSIGEPCPGFPTISDIDGNIYNTVKIGDQCWMKENLKVGVLIKKSTDMSDNNIIEKHCTYNDTIYCDNYGGYYQWDELMQYTNLQGSQGICPEGWHIPTDEEWKILEGTVDSLYEIGDPEWDDTGWRGYDVGKNLKSTLGWNENGNGIDLFGFNTLPTLLDWIGARIKFWSSTERNEERTWSRRLDYDEENVYRSSYQKTESYSVRCLKDD